MHTYLYHCPLSLYRTRINTVMNSGIDGFVNGPYNAMWEDSHHPSCAGVTGVQLPIVRYSIAYAVLRLRSLSPRNLAAHARGCKSV